jgi:hypothetical protein
MENGKPNAIIPAALFRTADDVGTESGLFEKQWIKVLFTS